MCIGVENSNTFIDILASFCTSSAQQPCQSGSIQGPPHSQFHIRKKFAGLYALKKLCIESQHPKLTLYKKKLIRKRTGKPIKAKLGSNFVKKVHTIPNENREVVLYGHFAGENSSLKFIIKFRKKICFFLTSFCATFQCGRYNVFFF